MKTRIAAMISVIALALIGLVTSASAAMSAPASDPDVVHCNAGFGPADPVTGEREMVDETCETMKQSERDSLVASLQSSQQEGAVSAKAGNFVLVILYEHINQGGQSSAINMYGAVCDTAGYAVTPTSYWQNNLSSLGKGDQNCNRADITNKAKTATSSYVIPASSIGQFNDNVSKLQIRKW